jgi:membrane associated rhomboid family serine protease
VLHGNLIHLAFNVGALLFLGMLIERAANRYFMPLVFLFSAFVGSVFSLYLLPNGTSVGASGGLLGMLGFLAVLGWYHRHTLPPGFLRSMLISLGMIALMGVVGYQFIDNAAHLGGLVAGGFLGFVLVPRTGGLPFNVGLPLKTAGIASAAVIVAVVCMAISRLL